MQDIALAVVVFLATRFGLAALSVPFPGPAAVVATLAVVTWRLHRSGSRWHAVGLRAPPGALRAAGWVLAAYAAIAAAQTLVIAPLGQAFGWGPTDVTRFAGLPGNLRLLLLLLAIAWTTAAFGEEMLFRGFLQNRLLAVLGGGRVAAAGATLAQAALFGAAHGYLGARGMATASAVGLVFGILYFACGRNLWPLILAHGLTDSLSLILIYRGAGLPGP
jgi:hypothetical protein